MVINKPKKYLNHCVFIQLMNSIKYVFGISELVMEIATHLDYISIISFYETLHKPIPYCIVKQLLDKINGNCNLCCKENKHTQLYQLDNNIYCYDCISICNHCNKNFGGVTLNVCNCGKVTCDECCDEEENDEACCRVVNGGGMWHKPDTSGIKISNSLEIINKYRAVKKICINDFKQLYQIFTRKCKSCSTKEFMYTCHQCSQSLCGQCARGCSKCNKTFCDNNTHLLPCGNQLCIKINCINCIRECNKCHIKLCESHLLKCYYCEITTCRKCFGYETNNGNDTLDNGKCLTCTKQYHKWKKNRK